MSVEQTIEAAQQLRSSMARRTLSKSALALQIRKLGISLARSANAMEAATDQVRKTMMMAELYNTIEDDLIGEVEE